MPKTKRENMIFTAITAWMMVYLMTLYNLVRATKKFSNITFILAFKSMWIEYILIFLFAYFVSGKIAKLFTFRIFDTNDKSIFIILSIQTFTVLLQVLFASILGTYHGFGLTDSFIPNYLLTYCSNFEIALPLQIFFVGPIVRTLFKYIN